MKKIILSLTVVLGIALLVCMCQTLKPRPMYVPEGHLMSNLDVSIEGEYIVTSEKDGNGCDLAFRGNEVVTDLTSCNEIESLECVENNSGVVVNYNHQPRWGYFIEQRIEEEEALKKTYNIVHIEYIGFVETEPQEHGYLFSRQDEEVYINGILCEDWGKGG